VKPIGRRAFLTRSAAAVGAGAGGLAAAKLGASRPASAATAGSAQATAAQEWRVSQAELGVIEPFNGPYQAGILTPRQAQAIFAALDSFAPDANTLADALQALSNRARDLTIGGAVPLLEVDAPPRTPGSSARATRPIH
jgi:deferrochelatase/peroxidase EfeB